jgi:FtsP/CotA-like multicopper oxidase with cupredoxin domain
MTSQKSSIFIALFLAILALMAVPVVAQHAPATPIGPTGFNPAVNYNYDNFAYSPNIRKFVDSLPGLGMPGCTLGTPTAVPAYSDGTCGANDLGQYIPVAQKDNTAYSDADFYSLGIQQYLVKMHSDLPPTTARGYYQINGSGPGQSPSGGVHQWLGPVIVAKSFDPTKPVGDSLNKTGNGNGAPVRILFQNNLPLTTWTSGMPGGPANLFLPVDTTLMGAGMGPASTATTMQNYSHNRVDIHLHGGATPWISDGTPHQWVTPVGETFPNAGAYLTHYQKGDSFQNVPDMVGAGKSITSPAQGDGLGTLYWSNQQSQRLMFYHDHAYGTTRLNVYGGMAAGYLLHDQVEDDMIAGTNVSGAFGNGLAGSVLPNAGGAYQWGVPLVIQDRSFVNDASSAVNANAVTAAGSLPTAYTTTTDPLWTTNVSSTCGLAVTDANGNPGGNSTCGGGNLWFPHEYMPNENIFDPSGAVNWGRWDYGPWLNPPTVPLEPILPSPSHVPETFADTMLVNGTPFPYLNVQPTAYRFRILSAGNDRSLNLQWYVAASKKYTSTPGTTGTVACDGVALDPSTSAVPLKTDCTEVKMVPATNYPSIPYCAAGAALDPNTGLPTGCTPATWPKDGRNGGVPDPTTAGPQWMQIGNEGGILPQVALLPSQPIGFEYSRRVPVILNINAQGLLLMPAERADVIVDFCAFAGKTLILYNDAPAPMPLFDERDDLYTGNPDQTAIGGPPSIPAGYGPNTRTVMQVNVAPGACTNFNLSGLQAAMPQAYKATQAAPIVPQAAYNSAFGTTNADTFVQNVDATVNLTGKAQGVANVMVTLPGSGYVTPPTVSFTPIAKETITTPATATACLNGVTALTVTVAGAGYTTAPAITFANPAGVTGTGSSAVAFLNGGGVNSTTMTSPGCNYTGNPNVTIAAPACTINGTTCVQATATASVTLGAVGSVTISSAGTGYLKAPLVTFKSVAGDPGKGATADAMLAGDTVIGMKNITEGFEPTYGRMNVQLGTTPVPLDTTTPAPQVPGIAMYIDPPSDFFNDGQVQVFRVAHLGVDSHIIHFHLMNLQVVNRVDVTNTMYPPLPNELGWKESIRTNPFTDLVVAAQPKTMWLPFAVPRSIRLMDPTTPAGSTLNYIQPAPVAGQPNPAGISNVMTDYGWEYVWHCHLLGHEENDMMRPIVFNPAPPLPPTNLTATFNSTNGNVVLNWKAPITFGLLNYQIQRSTSTAFTAPVIFTVSGSPLATTYTDNVTQAATYYYRVASVGQGGTSAWSNTGTVPVAPRLTSITPTSGPRGGVIPVTIAGSYLTGPGGATAVAVSGNGVTVSGTAATPTSVTSTFTIATTANTNIRSVTVAVPGAPASNAVTFTILGPTLTSIAPTAGMRGTTVPITLTGTLLTGATAVTASGTGVTASLLTVVNDTQVTASLTIAATAGTGTHNITVTTPAGTTNSVAFTVQAPSLTAIAPAAGVRGGTAVPITLTGNGLTGATAVTVSGTGVTASGLTAGSATQATATLTIAGTAGTGNRNVAVVTPNGTTNAVTFTVQGATVNWSGPTPGLNGNNLTTKIGTITVRNSATGTTAALLTLTAAPTLTTTAGTANGTFSITGGTCGSGLVVNPGATCTIIVQYVPKTTSQATAYVSITANDTGTATQNSPTFNGR